MNAALEVLRDEIAKAESELDTARAAAAPLIEAARAAEAKLLAARREVDILEHVHAELTP